MHFRKQEESGARIVRCGGIEDGVFKAPTLLEVRDLIWRVVEGGGDFAVGAKLHRVFPRALGADVDDLGLKSVAAGRERLLKGVNVRFVVFKLVGFDERSPSFSE